MSDPTTPERPDAPAIFELLWGRSETLLSRDYYAVETIRRLAAHPTALADFCEPLGYYKKERYDYLTILGAFRKIGKTNIFQEHITKLESANATLKYENSQLRERVKELTMALESSKSQFINILDYHAINEYDRPKVKEELKIINAALLAHSQEGRVIL